MTQSGIARSELGGFYLTRWAVDSFLAARNYREEAMSRIRSLFLFAVFGAVIVYAAPAPAQSIVDEWNSVTAPPAPELKPVTLDPKFTALLVLDLVKQLCSPNPRCVASLPKVQTLLATARANGATVIYSLPIIPPPGVVVGDTLPEVAPKGNDPVVHTFFDKFNDTDLDKILKEKGIKTVIIVGTVANGAVLYTGTSAFTHGYQTIISVDGISGRSPYIDQYVVYQFVAAPVLGGKVILTRSDMIKF
jgi:nicotinamidase-related amidase